MARRAGTVAHTSHLHRETVGHFKSEDMLDLGVVTSLAESGQSAIRERLLAPDTALAGLLSVSLDESAAARFTSGQTVRLDGASSTGLTRVYGPEQEFLGVGELAAGGQLAPRRVFQSGTKNPVDS